MVLEKCKNSYGNLEKSGKLKLEKNWLP